MSFTVIIDTKEKTPWELDSPKVLGIERRGLKTGDYTVEGIEDILCIERKASVSEIAMNIHQPRFAKELDRFKTFQYSYLILEANLEDVLVYPDNEALPDKIKKKIKVNGKYILRCLNRMQVKYNFNIIYAGDRYNAQLIALNLMEEVLEQNRINTGDDE